MYAQQRLERRPDARGGIKEKGGEKEVRDPDADVPEPARQRGKLSRPPGPKELPCRYQEETKEGDADDQSHLPSDLAQPALSERTGHPWQRLHRCRYGCRANRSDRQECGNGGSNGTEVVRYAGAVGKVRWCLRAGAVGPAGTLRSRIGGDADADGGRRQHL